MTTQGLAVQRDLLCFLSQVVAECPFHRIVTAERKGTAVMRMLIAHAMAGSCRWEKVRSSTVVEALKADVSGRRVLLFDDMTFRGRTLHRHRTDLEALGADVTTAAFAVHELCPPERRPDIYFHGHVPADVYKEMRDSIAGALQAEGSLLLDTEHIEVGVDVHCSLGEFFGALATCGRDGRGVEFRSRDGRHNLTLTGISLPDTALLQKYLPDGAVTDCVVNKCRLVHRSHNRYAIVPIFYPSVPAATPGSWWEALPAFVREDARTPTGSFYVVGLLAAIEVLRSVCTALYSLGPDKVTVYEPTADPAARTGALSHLVTLYPRTNLDALEDYIRNVLAECRRSAARRRRGDLVRGRVDTLTQESIAGFAKTLMQGMGLAGSRAASLGARPTGLTYGELLQLGQLLHLDEHLLSGLLDVLIDEAYATTRVERHREWVGRRMLLRTFALDGEVVAREVCRFSAEHGVPTELVEWAA